MAAKLGIPFTDDISKLGSNSAISDALIEKAVALGKTEAQINAAMAALWVISDYFDIFKLNHKIRYLNLKF
mgnify:CR=1 FL=1